MSGMTPERPQPARQNGPTGFIHCSATSVDPVLNSVQRYYSSRGNVPELTSFVAGFEKVLKSLPANDNNSLDAADEANTCIYLIDISCKFKLYKFFHFVWSRQ